MTSSIEAKLNEKVVQKGLALHISTLGWKLTEDDEVLNRPFENVFIDEDLIASVIKLNPEIAEYNKKSEEVISKLRAVLLSVRNDGLVASNEEFVAWLCGRRTVKYIGTDKDVQVKLIDFDDLKNNIYRVTTEATFHVGREHRRYDLVLWVNGIPLVVGELKTPINANISWLNGATDIHNAYEKKTPEFFVPNVLSFATEGREFRYGAVGQPPELWLNWSSTEDEIMPPGLPNVKRSAELLLTPAMVLDILRTYTLYSSRRTANGALRTKVIPRYPQVEAVKAIVERCQDPKKKQGLIWHHQGSGKTFAMAYAAAKLRMQSELDAPTIVIVLDRLELIQQTESEFKSVGIQALKTAETKEELRKLLKNDARGVIITTIYRFSEAGLLNDRTNIVVMVDEAHRTQEGRLGLDMREALPNAKFIGLTGTPISTDDRNTWEMFGDPGDPNGALNHYSVERSIYDGATLPVHVETRLVNFHFNHDQLQQAFDDLADEEELTEEQRGKLAAKAAHFSVVVRDKDRIESVCKDIVEHYRSRIAPLGLKAQIVAYDRATCVAYYDAITQLLNEGEEATVVMTTVKDDPQDWDKWNIDREQEATIKDRFRDISDPLKFVIVTAKLLTGFDAPIEGVMYLDKPLRAHTLFQAVCRTNRRWTNPNTGQQKLHGLIVDYVGLGKELAKALATKPNIKPGQSQEDVEVLLAELTTEVASTMMQFESIDRAAPVFNQISDAQQILDSIKKREDFAAQFMRCEGLFEFLWPNIKLRPIEENYKFLARVYSSIAPNNGADLLLWQRLGAKTMEIVHEHLTGVTIDDKKLEKVAMDAEVLELLRQEGLFPAPPKVGQPAATALEVLQKLEERIQKRLTSGDGTKVWISLAERLELLRLSRISSAQESVDFLQHLLELAKDLLETERADDEGRISEIKVVDPRKGALTQIFDEFKPEGVPLIIENVVEQVDELVQPVRGTGWQTSHPGDRTVRRSLKEILYNNGLPMSGDLFDRAYAYIKENY
jgi:type I restriction enzyme, R subunit